MNASTLTDPAIGLLNSFWRDGFVVAEPDALGLDQAKLNDLEKAFADLRNAADRVVKGDTDEAVSVSVARFVTDSPVHPTGHPLTPKVLELFAGSLFRTQLAQVKKVSSLSLRRAQAHWMKSGDFIGRHVDSDSNASYRLSVVVGFSSWYNGGLLCIETPGGVFRIKPSQDDIILMDAQLPHSVTAVDDGVRCTLACFYA